jgi:hypothetical protein
MTLDSDTVEMGNRPMTLEDIDAARHKEIMWKAVAGVMFLMLKHFKSNSALYLL